MIVPILNVSLLTMKLKLDVVDPQLEWHRQFPYNKEALKNLPRKDKKLEALIKAVNDYNANPQPPIQDVPEDQESRSNFEGDVEVNSDAEWEMGQECGGETAKDDTTDQYIP